MKVASNNMFLLTFLLIYALFAVALATTNAGLHSNHENLNHKQQLQDHPTVVPIRQRENSHFDRKLAHSKSRSSKESTAERNAHQIKHSSRMGETHKTLGNVRESLVDSATISPTILPTPKADNFPLDKPRQHNNTSTQSPTVSPPESPTASPTPLPHNIGRRFSISSDGNMAKLMKRDKRFLDASETIQNFTRYVETSIVNFLRNGSEPPPKQPLVPCNSDGKGFSKSMWHWFEQRKLPLLEEDCITELSGTTALENETENGDYTYSKEELLKAFQAREDALFENRYRIADVIVGNWSDPDTRRAYNYNASSQHCKIHHEGGVKVANNWYLFTSVLNKPMYEYLPLFGRQSITEMLHVAENRSLIPLHYRAYNRTEDGTEHNWINDTTTMLVSGQGGTSLARFQRIYPEEIPSLLSAIEDSDLWIQQAQDATTPSSLAILILPVFLNLVPIALLAQVKTSVMILYTILSDVVTVIPLGVKGVELIHISNQRHIASTIRLTSFRNGSTTETAAMQIWVAECKADQNLRILGIVFLTIAVVSLVVGVTLEFVAKAYMTRRTLKRRLFNLENEPLLGSSSATDTDVDATIGAVDSARGSGRGEETRERGSSVNGSRAITNDYHEV